LSGIIDLITGKQNLTIFVLIMSVMAILTRKKQALILTVSAWLLILAEYMFLQSLHRVPWRVTIGIWLMAGVILAEWLSSNTVYKNKAVKALLCLVFGFASVFCFQKHYIFMHMMKDKPDFDHFFNVIRHEHPDQFYLGDVETFCDRAMAADYAADHEDAVEGVVLLAAYPSKKLADPLTEISIYGSHDRVLNMTSMEKARGFASSDFREHVIRGGNHAQFGNYGTQRGDGTAKISADAQQQETVRLLLQDIGKTE
jgi:uncharacterized short protein YbdD (DUF466 family)